MKNIINKTILIIFSLVFGCLAINYSSRIIDREASAAGLEQKKIVVDHHLENKFLEMEQGKIPIGECADEAENFAQKIIDEMDIVYENLEEEIFAGNKLAWLPEQCECKKCNSKMKSWYKCCETNDKGKCVAECCNKCKCVCSGNVCPFNEIEKQVNTIQDADDEIVEAGQKIKDLIEAENLSECDPDRWGILNKLLNSRYKMERCLTGFEKTLKSSRAEFNFISCRTAINKIETKSGELVLLGYFENHISDYPYCYPYTANTDIRAICKENRDSDECVGPGAETANPYMDNYFCAGPFFDTGKEGGNKEGDEAPVCDDTAIPDPDDTIADTICMNYSKMTVGPNFRDTYCCDENCSNCEHATSDVRWNCDAQDENCVDMEDDDTWFPSKDCCEHFYKGQNIIDVIYQSIPSEDNRKIIWECVTD